MFTISPIGSCRITSPFRLGQETRGISLNMNRCYGYCHTAGEAIQMARFMRGEINIPDELWPLISRSATPKHDFEAQPIVDSDLFIVELASAKELSINGTAIQLNYLTTMFSEFFSETQRALEFWELAQTKNADAVALFLEKSWTATEYQQEEAAILSCINLNMADQNSLRRDIEILRELLPEVMFVSHVDAVKADGTKISSRSRFIEIVEAEARRAGILFSNPTDLMTEFGQSAAIEDNSTKLAHFTPGFMSALLDDWMHDVIAPMTDQFLLSEEEGALANLLRQVEADHARGRHAANVTRLACLPSDDERIRKYQEQAEDALLADLTALHDEIESRPLVDWTLDELVNGFERAVALGDFSVAWQMNTASMEWSGQLPTHVLMKAARRALRADEASFAFEMAYAVLARDPEIQTARLMINELLISRTVMAVAKLDPVEAAALLSGLTPVERLAAVELNNATLDNIVTSTTPVEDLVELTSLLVAQGRLEQAIELMAAWRHATGADRISDPEICELLEEWVAAAVTLPEPSHRVEALCAIRQADPSLKSLRQALQACRADFMTRTREVGKAGNLTDLEALAEEASLFPQPVPEYHLWRARLHFAAGAYVDALEIGRDTADDMPDSISLWILLMRSATKLNRMDEAQGFAGRVLDLACDRTVKFRQEAEGVLAKAAVGY